MIHKRLLPIIPGYLEVDINGRHTYMNQETGELTDNPVAKPEVSMEQRINLLRAQIQAASDQNDFLEECLVEMAGMVYA